MTDNRQACSGPLFNGKNEKQMKEDTQLPPERKLSYSLVLKAKREMRTIGHVETVCPKCHEAPVVDIRPYRLRVRCPCGFVCNSEIYD